MREYIWGNAEWVEWEIQRRRALVSRDGDTEVREKVGAGLGWKREERGSEPSLPLPSF